MSRRLIVPVLVLALTPISARASVPSGCADGSAGHAARVLVHPGATIDEQTPREAIAIGPFIAPGTPFTLLRQGALWCDAQAGFNHLRAATTTFAIHAGTPWFGTDVRIVRTAEHGPVTTVTTHALRNGIRARWTILSDARGILTATFRALKIGVRPFETHVSGLTALPGLTRTWVRAIDGELVPTEPVIPKVAPGVQPLAPIVTASDGFQIRVQRSNANLGPTFSQETGVAQLDLIGMVRDQALENYEEFLDWGFTGNAWDNEIGVIYIDNSQALTCLACVFISTTFQMHIFSEVVTLLKTPLLFGNRWTDDELGMSTVIGHEMFHNFQNASMQVDLNLGVADPAYSEGTARMSEALHTYSHTSWTPTSLIYDQTLNGCNGYLNTSSAVQAGPASNRVYDACAFWLTWFGRHGAAALADLLVAMKDHYTVADQWEEMRGAIQQATGASVVGDLAHFAGAILTRRGFTWAPVTGGDPIDWSHYLEQWFPPLLSPGESAESFLADGAMLGYEVATSVTVSVMTEGDPVSTYAIRDTGASTVVTPIASGASLTAPGDGEKLYVVAIYPGLDESYVTLSLS